MTYKINGAEIPQPTEGKWVQRDALGINGFGQSIYAGVRQFEMKWVVTSPSDYNALYGYFSALGNTGTAVVDLPQFAAGTYTFKSYSGCNMEEPQMSRYFSENLLEVTLLVRNIRT